MYTFFLLFLFLSTCEGLVHKLHIQNDDRSVFKIETFGFLEV